MFKVFFVFVIAFHTLLYGAAKSDILYKARFGNLEDAVKIYFEYQKENGKDDLELLENLALIVLEQGVHSKDAKEQRLSVFGASVARSSRVLNIFQEGLKSQDPQIQLASLLFLNEMQDDIADELIKEATNSAYLPIRFEAIKILASKKTYDSTDRAEGLMYQIDPLFYPLFPPLFASTSDTHSTALLKRCFTEKNPKTRHSALLACIDFRRDDLLNQIRALATCGNMEEQEAASFAIGYLQDAHGVSILKTLCNSPYSNVRLAAFVSLYKLGHLEYKDSIIAMANGGDLFAIAALGNIADTNFILYELIKSPKAQVKVNAALALLNQKDEKCLNIILDILVKDTRDIAIIENLSPGLVLSSWKVVSCASCKIESNSVEAFMIDRISENIIDQVLNLPKSCFYKLASAILNAKDFNLIPIVISKLEAIPCDETIDFLKKELQRAGAPLIRAYCNLSLYRLKEPGPYADYVKQWVNDLKNVEAIDFAQKQEKTNGINLYKLTTEQSARLFLESLLAIAQEKETSSLHALLSLIHQGNKSNRYAIAGLILRAIE
jgi:hypothetical protein